MSKPKILIYSNVFDTVVGQSIPYMDFFSQFGDVILVTSEMNLGWLIGTADILALPGGMDLINYRSKPGFYSGKGNPHYEYLDENLLEPWLLTGKPIIGICRGIQVLNVRCGGSLHRHINDHVQNEKLARGARPDDMFTVFEDDAEYHIYNINSYHHQGIKEIAPGFNVLGWSCLYRGCPSLREVKYSNYIWEKGEGKHAAYIKSKHLVPAIPEIIKHESKPYIGFQYHPEEFNCELATKLINEVIKL